MPVMTDYTPWEPGAIRELYLVFLVDKQNRIMRCFAFPEFPVAMECAREWVKSDRVEGVELWRWHDTDGYTTKAKRLCSSAFDKKGWHFADSTAVSLATDGGNRAAL